VKVSELYMRALGYAVGKGFDAKDAVCTWNLGGYRWMFNGKREQVEGVPFAHLCVFNEGGWPVVLLGANGGLTIGDLEAEDKLIAILKAENPVVLADDEEEKTDPLPRPLEDR
jgi:hypothetical protein